MSIKKTLIIAEAGVNHNGNIELAEQLIDVAAHAGVDYIKFQTFKTKNLVSRVAPKAAYQKSNSGLNDTQFEMLSKLELTVDNHYHLIDYCRKKGVNFFSTAFDLESIDFLFSLGLKLFKIPSGEITNLPYLKKVATLAEQVIISTGMCTLNDIEKAVNVFLSHSFNKDDITILHCNTEYPTPIYDVNLKAMKSISDKFGLRVGYSDHTLGIEVPIAAVALGATIIEKHFTISRSLSGPDHAASLEPEELLNMVKSIRNVEMALGDGNKKPSESETKNISVARKSIHAAKVIFKDKYITEDDLIMLRPGDGISPMEIDMVIGKKALKQINQGEKIDLKWIIHD